MRRNLDRRIEVLVPVEDPYLQKHLKQQILETCLKDNVQSWDLTAEGVYVRRTAPKGQKSFDAQGWFMENPTAKANLNRSDPEPTKPRMKRSSKATTKA
jgi:polyphosphate kinase